MIQISVSGDTTLNFSEFRRKGKQMRLYQLRAAILALACLTSAGPALAQNPSTAAAAPAQDVPTPPADNPTFLDGLRRVGVMAGQVVECRPTRISRIRSREPWNWPT